jgi:VPDSG-CTERM motif
MLPDVGIFNAVELSMKSLPKLLITLAVAAAFSFAHPAKANLITNPGFETGDFTGWTKVGLADVIGTNSGIAPHSGNFQARLFTGTLTQSVATTPGASYTINFFLALASNQSHNSFSVSWGGVPILSLTNQSPFGYTEYSFTETASTASTALVFSYNVVIPFSVWFLDDVSVDPTGVGVPDGGSTLSLLSFASIGLVALRRKLRC